MKDIPIRLLLAGIASILIGIFIQMDAGNDLHNISFYFEILGCLLVLVGLFYEKIKNLIN